MIPAAGLKLRDVFEIQHPSGSTLRKVKGVEALQVTNFRGEASRDPSRDALRAPSLEPNLLLSIGGS